MRLPYLNFKTATINKLQGSESVTSAFCGINQKVVAGDGEFSDMKNMSCREYPAICTRKPRGVDLHTFTGTIGGVGYLDKAYYVDGTTLYDINGNVMATGLNSYYYEKTFAVNGANLILFPDAKMVNVVMETQTPSDRVTNIDVYVYDTSYSTGLQMRKNDDEKTEIVDLSSAGNRMAGFKEGDCIYLSMSKDSIVSSYSGYYYVTHAENGYVTLDMDYPYDHSPATSTDIDSISVRRAMPESTHYCACGNRLWCCFNGYTYGDEGGYKFVNEVYASKLGDPTNWHVFQGTAMDSYSATIGEAGDFTGAAEYNGYPIFFKEDAIITVYGDKPSNFSVTTKKFPGAKYQKSIVSINQVLYYVGSDGVYAYNGVSPTKISEKIVGKITNAVGTTFDNKYYLSCLLDNAQKTMVYDIEKGIWDIEDTSGFVSGCFGDGKAYIISGTKLKEIEGSSTETIDWMLESVDSREGSIDMKYVSKLKFNLWLDSGTEVTVYMKYDNDASWKRAGSVKATKNTTYTIPIIPKRCNKYKWKMTGTGQGKLLAVGRTIRGGSERDGNIQI